MISSTSDRRAAARRRAWGRGPAILRFDSLEARGLMAVGTATLPDLLATHFSAGGNFDWDQLIHVQGTIANQGGGPTTVASQADVYISATPTIGPNAVKIGSIEIPAGLGTGQTVAIDQQLRLPATAVPNVGTDGLVYVELQIDPNNVVAEQNKVNNVGQGQGYDTSVIYIVPQRSSALRTSAFGLSTANAAWGGNFNVSAQVTNNAAGDAPATRARVVLTPDGITPGTGSDFTLGDVPVPAVSAYNTVNVVQQISLPSTIPAVLTGYKTFTVSLVLDADYVANVVYPHTTTQGLGIDLASLTLTGGTASPTSTTTPTSSSTTTTTNPDGTTTATTTAATTPVTTIALPDLASAGVQAPTGPIAWGQTFQVSTTVQNLGSVDSGPFDVRFVMTGVNGSLNFAINLGSVQVAGLKANFGQNVIATVRLPGRLPAGVTLSSAGTGRIVAIVDPENRVDELFHTNNTSFSNPVTLRVIGRDGNSTVPTQATGHVAATQNTTSSTSTGVVVNDAKNGKTTTKVATKTTTLGAATPAGSLAPLAQPGAGSGNRKTGTTRHAKVTNNSIGHQVSTFGTKVGHGFKKFFGFK